MLTDEELDAMDKQSLLAEVRELREANAHNDYAGRENQRDAERLRGLLREAGDALDAWIGGFHEFADTTDKELLARIRAALPDNTEGT